MLILIDIYIYIAVFSLCRMILQYKQYYLRGELLGVLERLLQGRRRFGQQLRLGRRRLVLAALAPLIDHG